MNAPAPHASPAFQQLERLVLSMPMAQTLGLKFNRIATGDVGDVGRGVPELLGELDALDGLGEGAAGGDEGADGHR